MPKKTLEKNKQTIASGVVHDVPVDVQKILLSKKILREKWNSLTPLARNEWICWVESVKKEETRKEHIKRLGEEVAGGKRRPCCFMGCVHRTDKPLSASQKFILKKQSKKTKNH